MAKNNSEWVDSLLDSRTNENSGKQSESNEVIFTQEGLEQYTESLGSMIRDNYAFNRQNAIEGNPAKLEIRNNLFVNNTTLEPKEIRYNVFKYYEEIENFDEIVTSSFTKNDNLKYILIKRKSDKVFQLGQLKIGEEDRSEDIINPISVANNDIILYIDNKKIKCYIKNEKNIIEEYKEYGASIGTKDEETNKIIPKYFCIYNADNELVWITFPQTVDLGDTIDIKTSNTSGALTINKNDKEEDVFVGGFSEYKDGEKTKVKLEIDKIKVSEGFDTDNLISFEKSIFVKGTDEAKRYSLVPYYFEKYFKDENEEAGGFYDGMIKTEQKLGNKFLNNIIKGTGEKTVMIAGVSSNTSSIDINFDIITFNSDEVQLYESSTSSSLSSLGDEFFKLAPAQKEEKCNKINIEDKYDNSKIYGIAYKISYELLQAPYITISDGVKTSEQYKVNQEVWICRQITDAKNYFMNKEVLEGVDDEEGWFCHFVDDEEYYKADFHRDGNYLYVKDPRQPYIDYKEGKITFPYVPLYYIENPNDIALLSNDNTILAPTQDQCKDIVQCQIGDEYSYKVHPKEEFENDSLPVKYYKDNFFIIGVEKEDNQDFYYTFRKNSSSSAITVKYMGERNFNIFIDDEEETEEVTENELKKLPKINGLIQIVGGEACIKENYYILENKDDEDNYYYLKVSGEFLSQMGNLVDAQTRVRVLYRVDTTDDINAGVLIDLDNFQNFYTKDENNNQIKLDPTDVLKGGIITFGGIAAAKSIKGYKVHAAVFNDYAEYRHTDNIAPGRCVIETGNGDLVLSNDRMQLGANIVSDTYGFTIGQTSYANTPIAVCGRVLAYPYEHPSEFKPGEAVCSGPDGTISRMKREEIRNWPDAIVGYVSEIPKYKTWGSDNVKVNGRIWIKVK